jgi:glycosyltransferase involved in cell wall biosynthesis
MRIIHCLRAPVGGLFRHVLDLAGAQAALGHEVGIIVDSSVTNQMTEEKLANIAPRMKLGIARFAMPRLPAPTDVMAFRAVRDHIAPLQLDILHGHGAKGGAYARLAGRAVKGFGRPLKVFYTPHGGTLHYPPNSLEGRFYAGLERALDKMTDGLIFESEFAARVYAERIGTGRAQRRVVHNGLTPADFVPVVHRLDAADLLFIGELRNLKGVDVLLAALAQLNAGRLRPVRCVIVGAGPDGEVFKAQAKALGLDGVVTFPGAMAAEKAFTLGRIVVVPSRKESFPYVVLEAAAVGLPVIATDVGGIPEIVVGTDTALVPPGDVNALVNALKIVVDSPELARSRAARLQGAVLRRFTVERMTSDIVAFYAAPSAARRAV